MLFYQVWLVLEKKISKIRQCIFTISYLSSLGTTGEHINKKKLKSSSPKDAKFGLNWAIGSGEEGLLNFVNIFSLFVNYLPLEIVLVLQLIRLESPFPKNALCQV